MPLAFGKVILLNTQQIWITVDFLTFSLYNKLISATP